MFSGAITALVTPMRDQQVDFKALKDLVEFQITEGIAGVVACGTTGEPATMTAEECARVIRATVEQARGRVPVIAGTGTNNTAVTIDATKAARELGADAALVVTPYYNKPTQAGLLAHFRAVAEKTDLPLVMYNVPSRTGCDMLAATVIELSKVGRLVAVKEATGSIPRAQELARGCPSGFALLSGDDGTASAFAAVGGHGVISVASNVVPKKMSQLIELTRAGKLAEAQKINSELLPLFDVLFIESNPIPVKAALSLMGYGRNELRLPLTPLVGDKLELLRRELTRQGVL